MSAVLPAAAQQSVDVQTGANADNQAIADAYDTVPYQSKPFAQSAPEQLAVMAKLFGLNPPDFRNARILELGCSAGGNLIPLAAKYPGVQAVGLDISKVEIEHGQQVIKQAGIKNCSLLALDIVKMQSEIKGQFDYIVCHGVFSWVPEIVRHAILDIIRDHLAPTGVAYRYRIVVNAWVWFLKRAFNTRVFHEKTAPEIIKMSRVDSLFWFKFVDMCAIKFTQEYKVVAAFRILK